MRSCSFLIYLATALSSLTVFVSSPAKASIVITSDTFGSGTNVFQLDFAEVFHTNNAADVTGYGAVPYAFRMGTHEISYNDIIRATASGMAHVTAGPWTGDLSAASISWYEAAAFVNWLNTSAGKQAAYNLSWDGATWNMSLWDTADAWQLGGENLYRHKDAFYFLPSENEWYKAAYYNGIASNYFLYPTGSDDAPSPVVGGTNAGTAVYNWVSFPAIGPALVTNAGGLNPYGTMGQGGNVSEWLETAYDGLNGSASADRVLRGGDWYDPEFNLSIWHRVAAAPSIGTSDTIGFRVASSPATSVPEAGTWITAAILLSGCVIFKWRSLKGPT
jgi:sulfatase modifying factor 1